jgi:hypothetical protein
MDWIDTFSVLSVLSKGHTDEITRIVFFLSFA